MLPIEKVNSPPFPFSISPGFISELFPTSDKVETGPEYPGYCSGAVLDMSYAAYQVRIITSYCHILDEIDRIMALTDGEPIGAKTYFSYKEK
jgi:hypothetical protein